MSIVDGKGLISWEGGLFTPDSALLPRVRWAFAQIRAEGGSIVLNEAGRPFGVPGDADVGSSSETDSGLSTVWYQWGRYLRGETPSAADPRTGNPYASEHTQGIAIDCNANPTSLRARFFPMVGLSNTIASESWHWAIRGPSQVDLSAYAWAGENFTPISPEEDDMTPEQDARLTNVENLVSLISKQKPGSIWIKNIDVPGAFALLSEDGVKYPKSSEEIETINRVMGGAPGVKREADPLNNQEYTDIINIWTR